MKNSKKSDTAETKTSTPALMAPVKLTKATMLEAMVVLRINQIKEERVKSKAILEQAEVELRYLLADFFNRTTDFSKSVGPEEIQLTSRGYIYLDRNWSFEIKELSPQKEKALVTAFKDYRDAKDVLNTWNSTSIEPRFVRASIRKRGQGEPNSDVKSILADRESVSFLEERLNKIFSIDGTNMLS